MFHYTISLNGEVKDVILRVEAVLKEEGFGVLWVFDIKEKLNSKGLNFEPEVVVLEVCNPNEAKEVLEKNILASYFLPCKITVLKEAHNVKVGMIKPSHLIGLVDDEELKAKAIEIENRLIIALEKLV